MVLKTVAIHKTLSQICSIAHPVVLWNAFGLMIHNAIHRLFGSRSIISVEVISINADRYRSASKTCSCSSEEGCNGYSITTTYAVPSKSSPKEATPTPEPKRKTNTDVREVPAPPESLGGVEPPENADIDEATMEQSAKRQRLAGGDPPGGGGGDDDDDDDDDDGQENGESENVPGGAAGDSPIPSPDAVEENTAGIGYYDVPAGLIAANAGECGIFSHVVNNTNVQLCCISRPPIKPGDTTAFAAVGCCLVCVFFRRTFLVTC